MRELAMGAIGVLELFEDREDRLFLRRGDRVDRMPARRPVLQRASGPAFAPSPRAALGELQVAAGSAVIPAISDRRVDERKQRVLGGRRHAQRDPATQSQRPFPSASISLTPISFSASESLAISACAATNSGSGPDPVRTPGLDAANASNAP